MLSSGAKRERPGTIVAGHAEADSARIAGGEGREGRGPGPVTAPASAALRERGVVRTIEAGQTGAGDVDRDPARGVTTDANNVRHRRHCPRWL
jgi:hypothetical protein